MRYRIDKIRHILKDKSLDALLISSPSHITYLTGYDHFTPLEREAYLLITRRKNYIITDGRYSEAVKKHVKHLKLLETSPTAPLLNHLKKLEENIKTLGFEPNNITVSEHTYFKKIFKKMKPIDLSKLRIIKELDEISTIEKACNLGDKAFDFILKKLKIGVTEKEIAFEIELFVKKHDAQLSFPTIVAFGPNSSIPHHATGNTKLKIGDFVLLDFGTKVDSYCSDMTRTVVFGKASEKQKKIYAIVLEAQTIAIQQCSNLAIKQSAIHASEIDSIARKHIEQNKFSTIPHSLGHGTGLEVHESPSLSPRSKDKLENGMVFSVEPGIYIPNFGGVRIEDLATLTKTEVRLLTKSPRELIEI